MIKDELTELHAKIAKLEATIAELRGGGSGRPPVDTFGVTYDRGIRFGMPVSAVLEMARAVPDRLMADIVNDFRSGPSVPKALADEPKPEKRGTGWIEATPLGPAPNSELVDRIVERFVGGPNKV
jgi:hypothetical protein